MMATIIINYVFIIFFYYLNTQYLVPALLINRRWWLYILSVVVSLNIYLFTPKQVATIFATPEYIEQNGNKIVIDKSGMNSGIYFLQIVDENEYVVSRKIVLQ